MRVKNETITFRPNDKQRERVTHAQAVSGWSAGNIVGKAVDAYFADGGGWEEIRNQAAAEIAELQAKLDSFPQLEALVNAAVLDYRTRSGRSPQ